MTAADSFPRGNWIDASTKPHSPAWRDWLEPPDATTRGIPSVAGGRIVQRLTTSALTHMIAHATARTTWVASGEPLVIEAVQGWALRLVRFQAVGSNVENALNDVTAARTRFRASVDSFGVTVDILQMYAEDVGRLELALAPGAEDGAAIARQLASDRARRVGALRDQVGLPINSLAKSLGITRVQLYAWLDPQNLVRPQGRNAERLQQVEQLADYWRGISRAKLGPFARERIDNLSSVLELLEAAVIDGNAVAEALQRLGRKLSAHRRTLLVPTGTLDPNADRKEGRIEGHVAKIDGKVIWLESDDGSVRTDVVIDRHPALIGLREGQPVLFVVDKYGNVESATPEMLGAARP